MDDTTRLRRHSLAAQAYEAARALYREYSHKNRPPEVYALYNAAKEALEAARRAE